MDKELALLIKNGLSAQQVLLPATVKSRLDPDQLPVVKLDNAELNRIFKQRFVHATHKSSAKLLMTATRDASTSGHALREAHAEVGYYLANEFISEIVGVETYLILHVTGSSTDGYRFRDEKETFIVPLMREGEPMAFGVSKALKLASFVHSYVFAGIKLGSFVGKKMVILVDSVVNSGKSISEYLEPLKRLLPEMSVIAGVVQAKAIQEGAFQ